MKAAILLPGLLLGPWLTAHPIPQEPSQAFDRSLDPTNPGDRQVAALLKAKDWGGLAAYLEQLPPADRERHRGLQLEALRRTEQWPKLLERCEAALPRLEANTGPKLGLERLLRAQALSRLNRHREAAEAHLENGKLGFPPGFENACAEAQAIGDWKFLEGAAQALAAQKPGPGLSYQGEALCKQLRFSEAEPLLEQAVTQPGHTAMAWADLAACRVARNAFPEALDAATRALAMEPANLEALYNRGRAHFGLQQYAEGRADFAAALATGKADPSLAANIQQSIEAADRYLAYQQRKAEKATKGRK